MNFIRASYRPLVLFMCEYQKKELIGATLQHYHIFLPLAPISQGRDQISLTPVRVSKSLDNFHANDINRNKMDQIIACINH